MNMAALMNVNAGGGIWQGGRGMRLCGLGMTQRQSSGSGYTDVLCSEQTPSSFGVTGAVKCFS